MNFKRFLVLILTVILIPIALSCTSPIFYNQYNVPISIYGGGYLIINASDYPMGLQTIMYPLKIQNLNNEALTVYLDPSPDLFNYIYGFIWF